MPNPDLSIAEGAIAPWSTARTPVLHPHARGGGRGQQDRPRQAVVEAHQGPAEASCCSAPRARCTVKYKNRYGRQRQYNTTYEGIIPFLQRRHSDAESDWSREQIEGYMREVPCPACGGAPPEAVQPGRHHRRAQHLRGVRPVDRRVGQVPGRPRAERAGEDDRRAGDQGDQRPHELPARRRARLPVAVALGRHAGRRRGAAHPAGQPDRLGPGRRAVRARRAVDRPAPARQPPPHRDARSACATSATR